MRKTGAQKRRVERVEGVLSRVRVAADVTAQEIGFVDERLREALYFD
jgi:hypothetical protein